MKENEAYIREIFWTVEFSEFYNKLPDKVRTKFDYVLSVVKSERVISTKFVKHLVTTDLYEMRVSLGGNEYRTIMFTTDNENIMLATEIILLNAFMKKSTKDYQKQIKLAENILKRISHEED
ncbi:MAG: type II toxin-antitoxin system RelE/ParE family toxin [Oscillibacter sp.]|nr:type II toxin-antitoxin system RelE/ParE family toxin [Oscillibacter sp.]